MLSVKNKKEYPIVVLHGLEAFVAKIRKCNLVKLVEFEKSLIRVVDCDMKSKFYFYIDNFRTNSGLAFYVRYAPGSRSSTNVCEVWISERSLESTFDSWYNMIKDYEKSFIFFDDPILNHYADAYYSQFEVIDEDAWKPLTDDKMLILDNSLKYIEENIEQVAGGYDQAEILDIKQSASEIRGVLTKESRASIAKRTAILWAKIKKQGIGLSKTFVEESVKELAKLAIHAVLVSP